MFNFYTFFAYVLIGTFTPGPNNIMSMSSASRFGMKRTLPFNFGVFTGMALILILSFSFGSVLLSLIPKIKFPMLVLGACYMLWLAFKILKNTYAIETSAQDKPTSFFTAILLQFINPKALIYGMTIATVYVLPYSQNPLILGGCTLLLSTISFSSTVAWALFGSVFAKLLAAHTKLVNCIMAALLVYCAVSLFL